MAGFWADGTSSRSPEEVLRRMADVVGHRGPDGHGVWYDAEAGIGLAHRRLAVLDLSEAGAQPMQSRCGRYVLVLNGEIYNHRELSRQLRREESFRGHSDTEVLLEAIAEWGVVEATRRSIGMFAFALWDAEHRTLSLARDRLGEKPLYVGWQRSTLLFASELRSMREHPHWVGNIDRAAFQSYMALSYVPSPNSIIEGIRKVPPGAVVTFHDPRPGDGVREVRYWSPDALLAPREPENVSDDERSKQLERLLAEVVTSQIHADVPIGAFLSGGIDSSLIVALMQSRSTQRVRTFTVGFRDQAYNEAPWAAAVAAHLGTEHCEVYLSDDDLLDVRRAWRRCTMSPSRIHHRFRRPWCAPHVVA
ncbi:MAG: asparagine synthase (glutamine-hydrolyzing) [Gemmatimonadaceae bacterium]